MSLLYIYLLWIIAFGIIPAITALITFLIQRGARKTSKRQAIITACILSIPACLVLPYYNHNGHLRLLLTDLFAPPSVLTFVVFFVPLALFAYALGEHRRSVVEGGNK